MSLPAAQISAEEATGADRAKFPGNPPRREAEPVASGASGRRFFRLRSTGHDRILMAYPAEPRENRLFADIAEVLGRNGIAVPKILARDDPRGLVWLEDLGERDLYSIRNDPAARKIFYPEALRELLKIQQLPADLFENSHTETLPPFDVELYSFEHRYFATEFLNRLVPAPAQSTYFQKQMSALTTRLESSECVWVHRDFQSKNLMIDSKERLRVVDFQGIRRGHRFYDLASLLCDPYVDLPKTEREALFAEFCAKSSLDPERERRNFYSACCQRLMQALGAYGRFGLGGGVTFFQTKITCALELLGGCAQEAGLDDLSALVEEARRCKNLPAG